ASIKPASSAIASAATNVAFGFARCSAPKIRPEIISANHEPKLSSVIRNRIPRNRISSNNPETSDRPNAGKISSSAFVPGTSYQPGSHITPITSVNNNVPTKTPAPNSRGIPTNPNSVSGRCSNNRTNSQYEPYAATSARIAESNCQNGFPRRPSACPNTIIP